MGKISVNDKFLIKSLRRKKNWAKKLLIDFHLKIGL